MDVPYLTSSRILCIILGFFIRFDAVIGTTTTVAENRIVVKEFVTIWMTLNDLNMKVNLVAFMVISCLLILEICLSGRVKVTLRAGNVYDFCLYYA